MKTKKNRVNSELGTQNLELRTGRPRFRVLSSGFLVLSFLALSACRQDMPAFQAQISEENLLQLLAYLKSLKPATAAPAPAHEK